MGYDDRDDDIQELSRRCQALAKERTRLKELCKRAIALWGDYTKDSEMGDLIEEMKTEVVEF